jgi:hypothetical protein
MELLYFSDVSQLDCMLNSMPELLLNKIPTTGDMQVSYELERLGIEFIDEWDFIEQIEIEENWNKAYILSKKWCDNTSLIMGHELNKYSATELIYPLQACLNARTIYGRLFKRYSIKKISGYFLLNKAVIRTGPAPTSRAVQSVTQAVLFYMADKGKVSIEKLTSSVPLPPL